MHIQSAKGVRDLDIKLNEFAYCTGVSILVCTTWWWLPWWPKRVVAASYPPFASYKVFEISTSGWLNLHIVLVSLF